MYDFLGYLTLALIPGFIALDLVHRHRRYDAPRYWRLYGSIQAELPWRPERSCRFR